MPADEEWFGDDEPGNNKYALVCVGSLQNGTPVAFLEEIYVRKELEGKGYAWGLLSQIEAFCKDKGITLLYTHPAPSMKDPSRRKLLRGEGGEDERKELQKKYDRWGFSPKPPEHDPVGFSYVKHLKT